VAGRSRLSNAGVRARLAALLVLVLLVHAVALDWFARELEQSPVLRPLATPMFTRVLQPAAPVVPPPPAPSPQPAVRAKPQGSAMTSAARGTPAAERAPKATRGPSPEPTPQPAPEPSTEAGAEPAVASAPSTPASAAESMAAPASDVVTRTPEASPAIATPSAAAASAAPRTTPDGWPADTRLNYRLTGNFRGELHGTARVQWQREAERYQTRVEIDLTLLASVVLTSQGDVTPQGLVPRAYEESRRGGPRGVRLGNENIMLNNGISVPRPAGVQDTASQFVELSHRFSTGKDKLEVGRSVSFWMARPGAVDFWTYDIVASETLRTPQLGPIETFHLKPRPIANPRGNITAEMWFAPSLQYLPVRIRVKMGEEAHVDLMVVNIEQR
jgi:outer membrane biosynthesis protein TonB